MDFPIVFASIYAVLRTSRECIKQEAREQHRNLVGFATHKFLLVFTNKNNTRAKSFTYIDHAGPIILGAEKARKKN
jgi:hypothetical protein